MDNLEFQHDKMGVNTHDMTTCSGCGKTIKELTTKKGIDWHDTLDDNYNYIGYCGKCYNKVQKSKDTVEHIKKCFNIENYRNNIGF